MPLFEYQCVDCGFRFDLLCKAEQADEPHTCTHCGGQKTTRMLSRFFATSGNRTLTRESKSCSTCSDHCCGNCH